MAKVLVVDDSKFMRRIIIDALKDAGHEVVGEAENGNEGIEKYLSLKPDLATMDMTMAGKDGMKAIKEIKKNMANAKIIVVSALSETTLKMNEPDLEGDAFLTKPFEYHDLIKAVEKVLKV